MCVMHNIVCYGSMGRFANWLRVIAMAGVALMNSLCILVARDLEHIQTDACTTHIPSINAAKRRASPATASIDAQHVQN